MLLEVFTALKSGTPVITVICKGDQHPFDFDSARRYIQCFLHSSTMRAELIGHVQPCMTDIYLHIDARTADYIRMHPYGACEEALAAS